MATSCAECGAAVTVGGACVEHFHALLYLESVALAHAADLPGGEIAHFYAVSSYVLQHPVSMGYTVEALDGLRQCLADHLRGRATLADIRRRVRRVANGDARVRRRADDQMRVWQVSSWPMTVADVLARGEEDYAQHVAAWAESIIATLDSLDSHAPKLDRPKLHPL